MSEPLYVIFDGPPSHESGRFVEVETADGKSVNAGTWENHSGKYWRLGPLYRESQAPRLETGAPSASPASTPDEFWAKDVPTNEDEALSLLRFGAVLNDIRAGEVVDQVRTERRMLNCADFFEREVAELRGKLDFIVGCSRAMGLDMSGNHRWSTMYPSTVRGPNLLAAIDAALAEKGAGK